MATRRRSSVALLAAVTVGAVLVVFELLVRSTRVGTTGARSPSSLVSEVMRTTLDVQISGWPALLVPILLVLVLGLLIDAMSGTRR